MAFESTPTATSTLTFSTEPPHERLLPHAVHEHVGHSRSNGLVRHESMSAYTLLSLSERVCEGILSPHSSWLMSSTAGGDACQVHVDQGLLDASPAPAVAFDHRRFEQGALQLWGTFSSSVPPWR